MADIYYKLDKKTREELISTVKRVAIEILEGPKETWITADEVTKMWPFFSKEWMKRYGYLLPRKRAHRGTVPLCSHICKLGLTMKLGEHLLD